MLKIGKVECQDHYVITDLLPDAVSAHTTLQLGQRHWESENKDHWVPEVVYVRYLFERVPDQIDCGAGYGWLRRGDSRPSKSCEPNSASRGNLTGCPSRCER